MLTLGDKIIAGSFKAGASWEVGDVGISAFGIDEALNKRRYLNGQVISQAQFVQFTAMLKSRVSVYPNLSTSEVNWQAEVTNSKLGQCGKFVIDDVAGTIRLPKVVNINGLQDLTALGEIKAESLPNIKGNSNHTVSGNTATWDTDWRGAMKTSLLSSSNVGTQETSWSGRKLCGTIEFDASQSSSTYQDNAPVQQEAVQYPYFIQVAEGVETSVDVSREIELNNPFSLLDYKYSEYELSNASWLLSNGQWNSRAVYQSVYDLLLQELNGTSSRLPYRSYINTVGNLVNTDGVLSGFSASNYAELPENFDGSTPWERVLKFTIGNFTAAQVVWGNNGDYRGFQVYIRTDGKFTMSGSSNNSTWNLFDVTSTTALTANTTYYLRVIYDGSKYTQEISTDGVNYNLEGTANVATPVTTTTIRLGTHGGAPFSGTIDLNESYININGERWWTGRRKIVTSAGDYTDTDFVLNTGDTTFRLPTVVKLASGKAVAGNGMTLGIEQYNSEGTLQKGAFVFNRGNIDAFFDGYGKQVQTARAGSSMDNSGASYIGITTDPLKSGIETSANGLYLYFYVGDTIQNANIIAAGQALTDIANLKAHYVTETYVNGTSGYRIWSDGYCEQWGEINVTSTTLYLLKSFANTNYNINIGTYDAHSPNDYAYCTVQWRDKAVGQVTFQAGFSGASYITTVDWIARGYIS